MAAERRWTRLTALAGVVVCLPAGMLRAGVTDSEGPPPVGIIESIAGKPVFAPAGARPAALDPARDVGLLIHAGDVLKPPSRSTVRLRTQQGAKVLKGPVRWVAPRLDADQQGIVSLALHRLEAPAEAPDPTRGPLFSPGDGSSVRPETAAIRWQPIAREISLRLTNEGGKVLWRRDSVSGGDGKIIDPAFNKALLDFRESVSQGKLTLTIGSSKREDGKGEGKVEFSLISEQAELSLRQELKVWSVEPEKSLLRFVGRAAAFGRRFMWNEEADELEAAVAQFPKSVTLLRADRAAQLRTGNTARAEALQRQLSQP